MRALRLLALAVGMATLAALILGSGVHQLGQDLARGGFKLLAVPAFMLLPLLIGARSWQILLRPRPSWGSFTYMRWVGDSVNTLMPVAQIGGLFVTAYLLGKRGVDPVLAMASALVAVTLSVGSLLTFVALGLILMALQSPDPEILTPLYVAVGFFTLPVFAFYRLQRSGPNALPLWVRSRLESLPLRPEMRHDAQALRASLEQIYRAGPRLWSSFTLQLIAWLLGCGEVWLIAWLLGTPVTPMQALILESLGQAVRNLGFFIPGALGLQEGMYLLAGPMLGLSPPLALSISLVKRFRELALGVPGLVVWQIEESWSALRLRAWRRVH